MTGERVETAGELDALPLGSVVVDRHGDPWMHDHPGWWVAPETSATTATTLTRKWAPLTLVHRPDRDLIADAYAQGGRDALTAAAEAAEAAKAHAELMVEAHDTEQAARRRAEATLMEARVLFREAQWLPSKYTRAPGANGDRVADLLTEDAYRIGTEGLAILDRHQGGEA